MKIKTTMNENLNLVEILKDCPKGTKLYSTLYGEVELNEININSREPIYILVRLGEVNYEEVSFARDGRLYYGCGGECTLFPSKDQRDWSKFKVKSNKPKFDPKTLQPFDKVLVRDGNLGKWKIQLFSHIKKEEEFYPYVCINESYTYCIPCNKDTEHLVGTSEEAPEFYRYWDK